MFELKPVEITKELLLSLKSEESYMEYYLGIPVKKGLFKSPLRRDSKPTCSFYRTAEGLYFKDFRGDFHGDFIDVIQRMYNKDFQGALIQAYQDLKLRKIRTSESVMDLHTRTDLKVKIKKFTQKELDFWASYGITKATLDYYQVYSISTIFIDNEPVICKDMSFGYYIGDDNGQLWKIYRPYNKMKFVCNTSRHYGNPTSGELLLITSSLKDLMVLHELGYDAIAPQSENQWFDDETVFKFKNYKYVIVFFDNDKAGIENSIKRGYPYITTDCEFKDISDYSKALGFEAARKLVKCQIETVLRDITMNEKL